MSDTIMTTIDHAGRIVVPKSVRAALGLRGGQRIALRQRDGVLEVEPAAAPVRTKRSHGVLHATWAGDGPRPTLTAGEVRAALEKLRR
jgi:AbrB family looped-hinge helix DNA binding protein